MLTNSGSLRARLALLFGIVLLGGGALVLLITSNFAKQAADEAYDKLLASAAFTAMESLSVIDEEINFDLPYASLNTLSLSKDDRVVYRLHSKSQGLLTGYELIPEPDQKKMESDLSKGEPHFFTAEYQDEPFRFIVLERLLVESGVQGKVWLQMGQSSLARQELADDLTLKALFGIFGLITLGLLFVWLAAGWSLKPLLKVEHELLQRQPTDLKPLTTEVPSEATHLVEAINRFMGRLQRNQDRNHAFIAEAAHQLRTPLASLQAQAELAADDTDAEQFHYRAERIRRNAKETNSRINQLLSYATLDHRVDVLVPKPQVLEDIVIKCLTDMAPIAITQNVELTFDNDMGAVKVTADPEAIREMLRNLVDNALKYGQENASRAEVNVSMQQAKNNQWVVLQVRDYGMGLPEELLQQVTRRFGRGEFRQQSGSGLGLAIVEQIMHGMGGKLELENGVKGGLKARLLLPISQPQGLS
ncbi:sensor histidine kinase [Leucothrix sargassi]|nr:sensor histidine kinase [Leucothrix sargassi]